MATNRIESLDPALLRPGRIDRKIEFPAPDIATKRRIFAIHTSKMTMAEDVVLEDFIQSKDDISGADIKVFFSILNVYGLFCISFFRLSALKLACWHCERGV
jgi:ATP-dependent 26S proteasome regulatory subunit